MPTITLIMPYYENPQMLQEQYRHLRILPEEVRNNLNYIVVDDGSPVSPAVLPEPELGLSTPMQLFRMEVDVAWNQDACRNIGVKHALTEWVMLTDMDHVVPVETLAALQRQKWQSHLVYSFRRVSAPDMSPFKWHPNTWFLTRTMYEKIGGYDERFAGNYGTDSDFQNRMLAICGAYTPCNLAIIRVPRQVVADASTVGLVRKNIEDKKRIADLKRQRGNQPPLRFQFPYHQVTA